MQCLQCGKKFKERRITAKYCSTKCRVYSHRKISVTVNVTPKQVSVTKVITSPVTLKEESKWDRRLKRYES